MIRKICAGLIALGVTTQAFADYLTLRQAFYYHAHTGNLLALQQLKSMGHSVDMSDEYGNSALCESVYRSDYSAFAMLKQAGATTAHPCVNKIPAEIVQHFNEGYANWAQAVNSGQIAYAGASTQTATAATAGTTGTIATDTGLSTAAMVGIGVGVAALVGGGIALAAGGGGGGGGHSSPAACSGHGTKDAEGICTCNDGWIGDNCENKDSSCTGSATSINNCSSQTTCKYGDQTLYTCTTCNDGWIGDNCENKDSSCTGSATSINNCSSQTSCKYGNQTLYTCTTCNDGWIGDNCENKDSSCTGSVTSINNCSSHTTCKYGDQTLYTCTTCNDGWIGDNCENKDSSCTGSAVSIDNCSSQTSCKYGNQTLYTCTTCDTGYDKYETNSCHAPITCGANKHQVGDNCVCNDSHPYEYEGTCYAPIAGGCGTNEVQQGGECVCAPGYDKINGDGVCTLTACPANTYKSDTSCVSCPENSTSPMGSTGINQCICNDGYVKSTDNTCVLESTKAGHIYRLGVDLLKTEHVEESDINVSDSQKGLEAYDGASITLGENATMTLNSVTSNNTGIYGMFGNDSTEGTYVALRNKGTITSALTIDSLGNYYGMRANSNGSTVINDGIISFTESGGSQALIFGVYGNRIINNGLVSLDVGSTADLGENELLSVFGKEDYRGSLLNGEDGTVSISGDHIIGRLMTGGNYTDLTNEGTLSYNGDTDGDSLYAMVAGSASSITNNGIINANIQNVALNGISYVTGMYTNDLETGKTALTNNGEINMNLTTSLGSIRGGGMYSRYGSLTNDIDGSIKMTLLKSESASSGVNSSIYGISGYYTQNILNNGNIDLETDFSSSIILGITTAYADSGLVRNTGVISLENRGSGTSMYGMNVPCNMGENAGQIIITQNGSGDVTGMGGSQTASGSVTINDNRIGDAGTVIGILSGYTSGGSTIAGNNHGRVVINSNLSAEYVSGIEGVVNNYGSIELNLLRTPDNKGSVPSRASFSYYKGINANMNFTVKNYGTIKLLSNNTSDDYIGEFGAALVEYGLFGIDHSSNTHGVQNYGTVQVLKESLFNAQNAHGIAQRSAGFLNGCIGDDCGKIEVVSKGEGIATGVYVATDSYTDQIINDGLISVTKEAGLRSVGAVRGITNEGYYSDYGDSFNIVNNGQIVAVNKGADSASGIYLKSQYDEIPSQIINSSAGTITVNATGGGNAYGIYVEAPSNSNHATAYKNISNEGTITVNATNANNSNVNKGNAYGIYASGRDVRVYNTGTIIVNGISKTGANAVDACDTGTCYYVGKATNNNFATLYTYVNGTSTSSVSSVPVTAEAPGFYTTRTGSGTSADPYVLSGFVSTTKSDDGVNHIFLTDGATFVDGGYTDMNGASVNFASMTDDGSGNYSVTNGFSMKTASASGSLQVDNSAVLGGNNTQYTISNAFISSDVNNLNLISDSALFDAKLVSTSDTTHDVVMTMRGFDTATKNKSLSDFLTHNYALGNNEAFFNKLKSFGDIGGLNAGLNSLTGQDMLSRFNFEDMTMMRELNFDMNDKLFHNKEQHFALAGSVSPMAFKGDTGSNARYSLFNKRDGNKSIGLGIAFTDVRSDDDHNDNARSETMYQLVVPMGYKTHGFNLVTSPRIGYARGSYDRTGFDNKSYDGTIEKRVFGLMNEARYPMTFGDWSVEPSAEFNILGYQQKGYEDAKEYALNIKSQNTYSVEGGFGLYLNKVKELAKDKTLKLNLGASVYHEFADPYQLEVGMTGMDGSFMLRDERRSQNRGVVRAGFDYAYRDLSLYGSLISYIDREARTSAKTGVKVKF